MLRLFYSNDYAVLASSLAKELGRAAAPASATGPAILVPNHQVAAYLKFAIASHLGVAANLSFPFLDSFLAALAATAGWRLIDHRPALLALVLAALHDSALLSAAEMTPVRDYLAFGGQGRDGGDAELRRLQLAAEVAQRFADYASFRPDMVAAWRGAEHAPAAAAGGLDRETEAWQRRLWRAVFADGGLVAALNQGNAGPLMTQGELVTHLSAAEIDLPDRIYAFGFSYMSPAQVMAVAALARRTELFLYAFNPCREFWEDVDPAIDVPPLALWGQLGREFIRRLNELSQWDFAAHFTDLAVDRPPCLLTSIQRDILCRASASQLGARAPSGAARPASAPGERSIVVFECPSPRRELEIIGDEIWSLVAADPTMRFNDIAVVVAPARWSVYQAQVGSVFATLHEIPHHLVDIPLASQSRVVEAFEMLLALPLATFRRPEVLGLATHPALSHASVSKDEWIRWTERLGIVHGADHSDHEATYIERDRYNWDQGLRRLALGAFMTGARSGDVRAVDLGGEAYLVEELGPDAHDHAGHFIGLCRSLLEDARYLRSIRLPLRRWRVLLDLVATSYLGADTDDDQRALQRCREAVALLEEIDFDGRDVAYPIAAELVRTRLGELRGDRGQYLAHGVTVAPLAPMRAIPYRAIFVAGLGEGLFPTPERSRALDLTAAQRRRGDIRAGERDRYTFLETLLAARDRLYLSWVCRDEKSGDHLGPSPLITELERLVSRYRGAAASETIRERHPLRPWDRSYFADLFSPGRRPGAGRFNPAAHRQARALALRNDLNRHLDSVGIPRADLPCRELPGKTRAALADLLALHELPAAAPALPRTPVPLALLRRFLECPLQAWAAAVLGLREASYDDLVSRQEEPFASPFAAALNLVRRVFVSHLLSGATDCDALVGRYRGEAERLELSGRAPTGLFSRLERERHEAILARWATHLADLSGTTAVRWTLYRWGGSHRDPLAGRALPGDRTLPPLALSVPGSPGSETSAAQIELTGTTEILGEPDIGSLVLSPGKHIHDKYLLRGLLDQLALSAAGIAADRPHATTVLTAERARARYRLGPISKDQAHTYLADLIASLWTERHDYLLPCEVILARWSAPDKPVAAIRAALASGHRATSCQYGPVTRLEGLASAPDALVDEIIARRFAPLLARVELCDE